MQSEKHQIGGKDYTLKRLGMLLLWFAFFAASLIAIKMKNIVGWTKGFHFYRNGFKPLASLQFHIFRFGF